MVREGYAVRTDQFFAMMLLPSGLSGFLRRFGWRMVGLEDRFLRFWRSRPIFFFFFLLDWCSDGLVCLVWIDEEAVDSPVSGGCKLQQLFEIRLSYRGPGAPYFVARGPLPEGNGRYKVLGVSTSVEPQRPHDTNSLATALVHFMKFFSIYMSQNYIN